MVFSDFLLFFVNNLLGVHNLGSRVDGFTSGSCTHFCLEHRSEVTEEEGSCKDEEECHDVVESVRDGVNEDTVCRNTGDSGDCKTFVDVDQLSSNPGGDKHDTGNRCCGRVNDVCKLLAGDAVFVAERSHNRTND